MTETKPCSKCGSTQIFRNVRVSGWATEYPSSDGIGDLSTDELKYTRSGIVRCVGCGKRRTGVQWPDATTPEAAEAAGGK